ncbi:hypothetical protein RFY98_20395, partial [Acinetobacter baumannii]|nr:hypothetical protein [Acinetobacter baumannii]
KEIFSRVSDSYRRIRNTLRFLLANLNGFKPSTDALAVDKAFSDGNVLAVVVFALFVGVALVHGGERFKSIRVLSHQFFE